ncbi:fimbrial protein [Escherichia coli]|uniref:fimbrial protein n=1 Tax=Escherichia coli TaxID=562 RepID=UPI00191A5A04|nr:fimbrial protein [Escherichia coli]CAD5569010.1 putative fimbrial protein FanC [Escherichia coli]
MKLKNIVLSSAVAAVMMSGFANAADNGEVAFLGAVTAQTCDIETSVDGAVTNLVQLGSVATGGQKSEKEFSLKLKDPTNCDVTNTPAAFVTWNASSLTATGLSNTNGTATDAVLTLTALNSKTPNTDVTSSTNEIEFVSDNVKNDGAFKFKATLTSGTDKGSVDTAAAYVVRYQ